MTTTIPVPQQEQRSTPLADALRKVLGGAAAGAGTSFLRDTTQGRALVRDAAREQVVYWTPWLVLGVVVAVVVAMKVAK